MQQTTGEKFKEYLRCILASEVLVQVYGQTSDHQEVIKKVKEEMEKTTTTGTQQYEPGVCEGQHYGEVIFGLRGIGPSIKTKLDEWKSGLAGGHAGSARVTGKKCAWPQQDTNQNSEEACNAEPGDVLQDDWLMGKINYWTAGALYLRVTTLLEEMKKGRLPGGKCAIEKNIKHQIKKVKDTVNPAAAKPAPAKPAPVDNGSPAKPVPPAKPVAAKPGPVTTTTQPGDKCQGEKVWEWKHKEVYVAHQYTADQWKPVKKVLDDFIKYLQANNQDFDGYGANCDNIGWEDMTSGQYHKAQTVADMMRCRLMSGALWFANGDNTQHTGGHMDEKEAALRCEVAHAFGHLLRNMYCKGQQKWYRGVEYAYKAMQKMGEKTAGQQSGLTGPVVHGKCTMCGYKGYKHHAQAVNLEIAQWLMREGKILSEIQQLEAQMPCNQYWQKYINDGAQAGDPIEKILTTPGIDKKNKLDKEIVEKAEKVFEQAKEAVEREIEKLTGQTEEQTPKETTPETGKTATPSTPGPAVSVGRSEDVVETPPPADGSERAGNDKSQPTCPAAGASHTRDVGEGILSVSVTFDPSSDPKDCSGSNSPETPAGKDSTANTGTQDTQVPAEPEQGPEVSVTSSGSDTGHQPATPTEIPKATETPDAQDTTPAATKDTNANEGGHGPDQQTDDKVTTKPSDTAALYSFGDFWDSVSGVTPPDGAEPDTAPGSQASSSTSHKDKHNTSSIIHAGGGLGFTLDMPTLGTGLGGHYGTGHRPSLEVQASDNSGGPGDYAVPDLTDTVLTATTPVLFFLSAVTVALLGYSLWKYFAYLAKRRRTYRTVRNVPSPPLDEDILAHLQRGAPPPPDYGYTMVTQPASAAVRRGQRPPRVHKRTIIDLHLEVLNECEAAVWENVKDDYLQILVKAFAQECARDLHQDTHNSILDVSTSDQDLPGINVSYTDFAQTDPCPPHDPDSWSCMETIQLQTHPCPPNEHDPDPWSCMENIQLHHEQNRPSDHGDKTSACTQWINWIDRHKYMLRACSGEPWFLQLKADWKQYLRAHMVADEASSEHRTAATMESTQLDAWKEWIARKHKRTDTYSEEEWFKHLLSSVEEETVPDKGDVPIAEKDLEVEKVMAAHQRLRLRDVPRSQLHPQPYMKQPLTAHTWMLLLASVIEQCEIESSMQDRELYVDALLDTL
ncbi:hypothetical protein AK88_05503 [Plasmodium fragile]|uniref:Schizont-infected cell agglutination C-terminal domain-containing protein n=1 Tax=Plasmodium fragile TaxID=5857 RepID=A0A0D9QGL4_PLAFR|nr:uncharacterized protein AK88_05503 [Plasmodium fragile]KJP84866.1 hypothetical protein AK88_05503 [Plasmodium fragile]